MQNDTGHLDVSLMATEGVPLGVVEFEHIGGCAVCAPRFRAPLRWYREEYLSNG